MFEIPVISSMYWKTIHVSRTPEELKQDLEGLQILRILGRNMMWF